MKTNRFRAMACWTLMAISALACGGDDTDRDGLAQPSEPPAWETHDSDTAPVTADELRQRRMVPGHTEVVIGDTVEDVLADAGAEPVGIAAPPRDIDKLTWPGGYGVKSTTNGVRCWVNGANICDRPKSRSFRYRFMAGTCTSYYQGRFVYAANLWLSTMAARGWTIQGPTAQGNADYYLQCGDAGSIGGANLVGAFQASGWEPDANGDYTWKSGWVTLDSAGLDAFFNALMPQKTQTQEDTYVASVILHELLHVVGLGHSDAMSVSAVMSSPCPQSCYSLVSAPNNDEITWLNNYQP